MERLVKDIMRSVPRGDSGPVTDAYVADVLDRQVRAHSHSQLLRYAVRFLCGGTVSHATAVSAV